MADLIESPVELGLPHDWIVAAHGAGQVVFRIVEGDTLTVQDFASNREKGQRRRTRAGEDPLQYMGISVFASEAQARAMVDRFPQIGKRLAAITLSQEMQFARTRATPGHHTAWGDVEAFSAAASIV